MICNFKWKEVIHSNTASKKGIPNIPTSKEMSAILTSVVGMQAVRDFLGVPIIVTSWFRCLMLNRLLGSRDTSAHLKGYAVDFVVTKMSLEEAFKKLKNSGLEYDQLIIERNSRGGRWIHISFDPRMRKKAFRLEVK